MLTNTIFEIIRYIENPVIEKDKNKNFSYRIKKFFASLFIVSIINICIISVIFFFEISETTFAKSTLKDFFYGVANIFFIIYIFLTCFLSEVIFRGFLHKSKKNFKPLFYLSAILFAFFQIYDICNIESENIFLILLLLFLGQFFLGLVLGFTHIRFGFLWAYLLNVLTYIVTKAVLISLLLI